VGLHPAKAGQSHVFGAGVAAAGANLIDSCRGGPPHVQRLIPGVARTPKGTVLPDGCGWTVARCLQIATPLTPIRPSPFLLRLIFFSGPGAGEPEDGRAGVRLLNGMMLRWRQGSAGSKRYCVSMPRSPCLGVLAVGAVHALPCFPLILAGSVTLCRHVRGVAERADRLQRDAMASPGDPLSG
jgi:hypothetical protein